MKMHSPIVTCHATTIRYTTLSVLRNPKKTQPHDLADIFCHVHWLKHRETHTYVVKEGIFTLLKRSPNMLTLPTVTHKSVIILHCFGNLSVHPD